MFNMMYDEDEVEMEIPYTVFGDAYNWDFAADGFSGFYVFTAGTADTTLLAAQIQAIMESKHNCRGKNVINIQDFNSVMDQINNVMGTITLFVVVVAGISLLVGGIGVMTIMLVSVTERTREIGIRKALGARTGTIMLQFLIESGLISLCAGIIGIITGVALASIVGYFLDFKATIDIVTVLGASVFSSAVGIFFGIYPAKKAAKLSPIEALRHE
jgi:putative ABC transport system permease protein